jgi:hypothetical protein
LIPDNLDPDSIGTEEAYSQSQKHSSPTTSTKERTIISTKPVRKNTHLSFRDNLESDSIVTEESNPQSEKHFESKTSTDAGIIISIKPGKFNA